MGKSLNLYYIRKQDITRAGGSIMCDNCGAIMRMGELTYSKRSRRRRHYCPPCAEKCKLLE